MLGRHLGVLALFHGLYYCICENIERIYMK